MGKRATCLLLTFFILIFITNGYSQSSKEATSSSGQSRQWKSIKGSIGVSKKWGSGWIDLDKIMDFKKGDHLRLKIGGKARKAIVRFLEEGKDPNDPVGIDQIVTIPENRIVEIELKNEYHHVIQISIHGGPNPWGLYPLGGGNGPATLVSVEFLN